MKAALLAVFLLGFAVLGDAQTTAPEQRRMAIDGHMTMPDGSSFNMKARDIKSAGDVLELRGDVQITVGFIKIMADEVDLNKVTLAWDLRGNVRIVPAN